MVNKPPVAAEFASGAVGAPSSPAHPPGPCARGEQRQRRLLHEVYIHLPSAEPAAEVEPSGAGEAVAV